MTGLSVKPDTAVNVLRYILYNSNASISEIVEACSVSTQSASQTVRLFLDSSLLVQGLHKEKVRSGMRPQRYRLNPKYNFIVYSISDSRFRAKLINADGKILSSKIYSDRERILCEEDFKVFVREFDEECSHLRKEYRIGSAVVFSTYSFFGMDITDAKTLAKVRAELEDTVRVITGIRRASACSREALAGEYFAKTRMFSDKTIIYLCLNRDQMYSAAFINGQRIVGASGRGFNALEMRINRIRSADYVMKNPSTPDDLADVIAIICANARAFYDPHIIYLDTEDYRYISGLAETVNTFLHDKYKLSKAELPVIDFRSWKRPSIVELGACTLLKGFLLDDIKKKLG